MLEKFVSQIVLVAAAGVSITAECADHHINT